MYRICREANRGFTLIEIIIAIAIIGFIALTFMPIFAMSAKTNSTSETTLDATYSGKDAMELAYELSRKMNFEDVELELGNREYAKISENKYRYSFNSDEYLDMEFTEEGNLIRVIVKVYEDRDILSQRGQYEALYSWRGRGVLQ